MVCIFEIRFEIAISDSFQFRRVSSEIGFQVEESRTVNVVCVLSIGASVKASGRLKNRLRQVRERWFTIRIDMTTQQARYRRHRRL